jgi:hypothetical protein
LKLKLFELLNILGLMKLSLVKNVRPVLPQQLAQKILTINILGFNEAYPGSTVCLACVVTMKGSFLNNKHFRVQEAPSGSMSGLCCYNHGLLSRQKILAVDILGLNEAQHGSMPGLCCHNSVLISQQKILTINILGFNEAKPGSMPGLCCHNSVLISQQKILTINILGFNEAKPGSMPGLCCHNHGLISQLKILTINILGFNEAQPLVLCPACVARTMGSYLSKIF